ncbi:molybdenum cofactor biosynthesis protein MoaE [Methyloterricola oryzae]|uniref:molybdenum cofactor biosynthesis protein MoaE n=1 Tax=Methyloterricola oryzae TaxID=1495050 RepID=UPI0005EB5A0D|nr:molybdenum cofactor biosynthesis protein MoaE [Methyloterricola oryzae]
MLVSLRAAPFDAYHELERYQSGRLPGNFQFGATASFVGTMRDFNDGTAVANMTLEYYPGMTEKCLERIVESELAKWPDMDCLLVHRVGDISPGESIVLVAVWSSHRGPAFDACRKIMEELKARAPFWKRETLPTGEQRWVEKNTDGYVGSSR